MARKRISENWFFDSFKIFFRAIKLYFINFEKFLKLMTFPIFGQIIGLFLIFLINYFFVMNVPQLAKTNALFNNITFVFTLLIIAIIPSFLIFAKAFWDYLLAMASLTLMANHILSSGELTEVEIHKDIIKTRIGSYVLLLIVLSFIFTLLSFPLFWILLIPISILLSLSIQAFVMEDNLSPFGAIKRSYLFVRYNFFKTTAILILLILLCYIFCPTLFLWAFDKMNLPIIFTPPVDLYINLLPIDEINSYLATLSIKNFEIKAHELSAFIVQNVVSFIVIGFTLPIRAIACCDLYKDLRGKNITQDDTEIKKIVKRATSK